MSFFAGIAGHWRLGVCTDREVEGSWSVEIVTTRFASSLASSDRDGTKGRLWGQKELLVQAVKSQGELAEQDKMLLLMVSRWWKRCRRVMV